MKTIRWFRKESIYTEDNAPTPAMHASTVALLPDGRLMAAWFGGEYEHHPDVRIFYAFRENGVWTKPREVPGNEGVAHWNPVLFVNKKKEILLFYKVGSHIEPWRTFITKSCDNGATFSEPRELVPGDLGGRGPVKNPPIYLSDGTLLAPASIETDDPFRWYCIMDRSMDDGETWECVEVPEEDIIADPQRNRKLGMIQPTLWESEPGHVHALMRSNGGKIYRTDSEDCGKTFCTAYPTAEDNNNSGICLTKLDDGTLLLVSNPVPANWGVRTPLTVKISYDNGQTFEHLLTLENNPGEYSYPTIISKGNHCYLTYTYLRKHPVFAEFELQ